MLVKLFDLQLEAQLDLPKKEIQDHTYRCAAEAKMMIVEVQREAHDLDVVEREAAEFLKVLLPSSLLTLTAKALHC